MPLTKEMLQAIAPQCPQSKLAEYATALEAAMKEFGILSKQQRAMFLAQLAHESAGFSVLEENLNYSAERLVQVWPTRFPNLAAAQRYARNPEALANKVYGGRMGNTVLGDGYKFRGRGFIQLTGRENYRRIGRLIRVDLVENPDQLKTATVAARSAAAFWSAGRFQGQTINSFADRDDVVSVTKFINGGLNGFQDRKNLYVKALKVLD